MSGTACAESSIRGSSRIRTIIIASVLALATQILVFPLFGIAVTLRQNALLGLIFLAVSFARAYILRRLFEA